MSSTRSRTVNKRKATESEISVKKSKKRVSICEPNKEIPSQTEASDILSYIEGKKPDWDDRIKELWLESLKTSPLAFIDDIINMVNDKMYNMLSALQKSFEKLLPDPAEVEERMTQIDALLESAVDRNYDVFELYALKNIFTFHPKDPIPPLHYQGLDLTSGPNELTKLKIELKREREKLIGAEYFSHKASLFHDSATNFIKEINHLVQELVWLDDAMNNSAKIPSASELTRGVLKFEEVMTKYKESLAIFKDPTLTRPTQRDMFLKVSTLKHISKLVPQYDSPPDSDFQIDQQYAMIKDKNWDDLLTALDF